MIEGGYVTQVNDGQTPGPGLPGSQGEALSKRCITLIKTALKPEIWQNQCRPGDEVMGRAVGIIIVLSLQLSISRSHGLLSCWRQL